MNHLDREYEAQQLNEYVNMKEDDLIHWEPVARLDEEDKSFIQHIAKLKAMKEFNEGKR
jgi:predicted class III extradiol MEMO1 family dioxygenase